MDTLDIDPEIDAFSKKAAKYRKALALAPNARIMEVAPILGIIEKLAEQAGEPLNLCDAMAGSGYLSKYLAKFFPGVIAAEACEQMISQNSNNGIRYVRIRDAKDLPQVLAQFETSIAVSLASFHHLLISGPGGIVDRQKSIAKQANLVKESFQNASRLRHFLIVDVPVEPLNVGSDESWPWKSGIAAAWRRILGKEPESAGTSFEDFRNMAGNLANDCPARPDRWFREVVDPHSITGHHDCFLGKEFVNQLIEAGLEVRARTVQTPWLFASEDAFKEFLWHKFAFREDDKSFGISEALKSAREYLGVRSSKANQTVLGWQLAFVIVTRKPENK
jgi:hypothetical protein